DSPFAVGATRRILAPDPRLARRLVSRGGRTTLTRMYGYQPPEQDPSGSWSEVLLMIKVVFQMLAPLFGIMAGALLLLVLALFLFFYYPPLRLILGAVAHAR